MDFGDYFGLHDWSLKLYLVCLAISFGTFCFSYNSDYKKYRKGEKDLKESLGLLFIGLVLCPIAALVFWCIASIEYVAP